mmetsp:Transcript_17426/g.57051  ORF Transcript_17426/g.57051 Transcript_17426/m.57051 type:complete len:250 (-) Transcript_17426:623-1372(-)
MSHAGDGAECARSRAAPGCRKPAGRDCTRGRRKCISGRRACGGCGRVRWSFARRQVCHCACPSKERAHRWNDGRRYQRHAGATTRRRWDGCRGFRRRGAGCCGHRDAQPGSARRGCSSPHRSLRVSAHEKLCSFSPRLHRAAFGLLFPFVPQPRSVQRACGLAEIFRAPCACPRHYRSPQRQLHHFSSLRRRSSEQTPGAVEPPRSCGARWYYWCNRDAFFAASSDLGGWLRLRRPIPRRARNRTLGVR